MKISFVIPTFNEHGNILILIKKINKITRDNEIDNEIIVVDDNSTDGTIQDVKALQIKQKNLRLVIRKKRLGVGSAHIVGYNLAKYNLIISMDADLSHSPEKIPEFIEKLLKGYDIVIGSRYIKKGKTDKNLYHQIISKIGCYYLSKTLKIDIHDFSTGYRLIKKEIWNKIKHFNYSSGNTFLIESIYQAYKHNAKIVELPIHFKKRIIGKSKTPILKEAFKALMIPFKIIFSRK